MIDFSYQFRIPFAILLIIRIIQDGEGKEEEGFVISKFWWLKRSIFLINFFLSITPFYNYQNIWETKEEEGFVISKFWWSKQSIFLISFEYCVHHWTIDFSYQFRILFIILWLSGYLRWRNKGFVISKFRNRSNDRFFLFFYQFRILFSPFYDHRHFMIFFILYYILFYIIFMIIRYFMISKMAKRKKKFIIFVISKFRWSNDRFFLSSYQFRIILWLWEYPRWRSKRRRSNFRNFEISMIERSIFLIISNTVRHFMIIRISKMMK